MCFTTLARKPLILLVTVLQVPRGSVSLTLSEYISGVPCWTRLLLQHRGTNLHDYRPAHYGGQPMRPIPFRSNGPWFKRRQKQRMGTGSHC